MPSSLKHEELTKKLIGLFYEVHNELGHGFVESVYENSYMLALNDCGIRAENQVNIPVTFRDRIVGSFRADVVIEKKVILELKAASSLVAANEAQLLNYLRATDIEVGLLLNFGERPAFKRLVFDNARKIAGKKRSLIECLEEDNNN